MRNKLRILGAIAAGALMLSACSGGGGGSADGNGSGNGDEVGELRPVTVGVLPIVPSVAFQVGIEEGIFEKHGFDVTLESGQGGAALLPAVVSQQIQFAISNPLSTMLAVGEGLDVRQVTGYSHTKPTGDDVTSIWARADSDITSMKDLEGKKVAVNNLKTMGEVSINEIVARDGGDPSLIEYVELGFPDMPAALEQGNIDVAWVPEPFQTIFKNTGAKLLAYNYQEAFPGIGTMTVITSGALIDSDPEFVEAFVAAIDETTAFAQANEETTRATLVTFLDMDEDLANQVLVEDFRAPIDQESMQRLADLALEYGILSKPVDMDSFLP